MRRRATRAALGAWLVLCFLAASAGGAEVRTESKHFVLTYETGTSFAYVDLVRRSLEAAYEFFVVRSGFPTFSQPVTAAIRDDADGNMGSEYLDALGDATPIAVIEIATEPTMRAAATANPTRLSLEQAVLSTTAHEFFHVLQDYASFQGDADVTEAAFVEPLATAAQEMAAPDADDYIAAAADLLLAPDAVSFFERGYDAGLFWVYVLDRFGGLDALRAVMAASVGADSRAAIDEAFAPRGLTFLDLWVKFLIALATGSLPDADGLAELRASWESELGRTDLDAPPAVAVVEWTGTEQTVARVTERSFAEPILGYSDRALGKPLCVTSPYGIDVVAVRPRSSAPLAISLEASPTSDFRVVVVGRRSERWALLSASDRSAVVPHPERYDELRVYLTRGDLGDGVYALRLAPIP